MIQNVWLLLFLCSCTIVSFSKEVKVEDPKQIEKIEESKRYLSLGYEYLSKKEGSKSESMAIKSIRLNPTKSAYILLGKSLFAQGKYDTSLEVLEQTFSRYKDEESGLVYAQALTILGKIQEASRVYEFLEELHPEDYFYKWKLAQIFHSNREYKKAIEKLLQISAQTVEEPSEYYMFLSELYYLENNFSEAEMFLKKAKQENQNMEKYISLEQALYQSQNIKEANQFFEKGEYNRSIQNFQKAYEMSPSNDLLYFIGLAQLKSGDTEASKQTFQKLIQLEPNYKEAHIGLSFSLYREEKINESIKILESYNNKYGHDPEILQELAFYKKEQEKYSEAHLLIQQAIKLKPKLYSLYEINGMIFADEEKWEQSEAEFIQAQKLHPSATNEKYLQICQLHIHLQKANEYFKKGKLQKSIKEIESIPDYNKNQDALNLLGKIEMHRKNYEKSREYLESSLNLDIQNIDTLELLIILHTIQKEESKVEEYKKLIEEMKIADPIFLLTMARKKELEGEISEAESIYQKMVQSPNPPFKAKWRLGQLYLKLAQENAQKGNLEISLQYTKLSKRWMGDQEEIRDIQKQIQDLQMQKKMQSKLEIANQLFDSEKYLNALEEYQSIYQKWKSIPILMQIGNCFEKLKQTERGISFLLKEKKQFGVNNKLEEFIASYYFKMGLLDESEKTIQANLANDPENDYLYYLLGMIYLEKNPNQSIFYLEKSIAINPKWGSSRYALGNAYFKLKDFDNAKKNYELAKELSTNPKQIQLQEGVVYSEEKKWKEAESIFFSLIQNYPTDSSPHFHLGNLYYQQNFFAKARKSYLKAISLENKSIYLHNLLKTLDKEKNKKDFEYWKKVLIQKFPTSKYSKYWIASSIEKEISYFYIREFELMGDLLGTPEIYNQYLILNYGHSLTAYHIERQKVQWRKESKVKYEYIHTKNKLLAITKDRIEQIHPVTGETIWVRYIDFEKLEKVEIKSHIYVSGVKNKKRILIKFTLSGDWISQADLENNDWYLSEKEILFLLNSEKDTIEWKVLSYKLAEILPAQNFISTDSTDYKIILISSESIFLHKSGQLLELRKNGEIKIRSKWNLNPNTIFVSNQGELYKAENKKIFKYLFSADMWKEMVSFPHEILFFSKENENIYIMDSHYKFHILDENWEIIKQENLKNSHRRKKIQLYSIVFQ
jgi:tetratricopeptide (TPR) repeat protein